MFFISGLLQAPLMPHYETSPLAKFLLDYWTEVLIALEVLGLVFIGFTFVMPGLTAHLEYRRKFKQTVATEVFKAVVPDGTYQPDHHLSQKAVDESGLFSGKYHQVQRRRSDSRPRRSDRIRSLRDQGARASSSSTAAARINTSRRNPTSPSSTARSFISACPAASRVTPSSNPKTAKAACRVTGANSRPSRSTRTRRSASASASIRRTRRKRGRS